MDKCIPRQHDEAKNIEIKIKDIFMLRTCQTNCKIPFTFGYLVLERGKPEHVCVFPKFAYNFEVRYQTETLNRFSRFGSFGFLKDSSLTSQH